MKKGVQSVCVFSPAKVNLFLAVTGKRLDGFHDLVSVVAPLVFGDVVTIVRTERNGSTECLCEDSLVPNGKENLAVKAVIAWRERSGDDQGYRIFIRKRIPVGGGLGGGSSNAVAVLKGLNFSATESLPMESLQELASSLGSDCPLFLAEGPSVIEGRGELVEPLPENTACRMRGRRLLLFAPSFGMETKEIYSRMSSRPEWFTDKSQALEHLSLWRQGDESLDGLIANDLETPVFSKWPGFPVLFEELRERLGWVCGMSGSGSCCFAVLGEEEDVKEGKKAILAAWGEHCFLRETTFL